MGAMDAVGRGPISGFFESFRGTKFSFYNVAYFILLSAFLWVYTNKFLGMSADYIEAMARDITLNGTQMNPSFIEMSTIILVIGGTQLILFLLVQNDFSLSLIHI